MGFIGNGLMTALMAGVALPAAASAQQVAPVRQSEPRRFDIPAGPLGAALNAWSRQSGRSILFRTEDVATRRTGGVRGRMSDEEALGKLLAGSGFIRADDESGAVAIIAAASANVENLGNATPDILVTGRSAWSLNTGIERSQNDSQPFIVMTREEIERSGAPNLETFLRDRLNVNTSPGVSQQARPGNSSRSNTRGLSSINLRGLGVRDTLILVDGRRQPGVNIGDGTITQASITGIPIASIERIEVLASSASGIYGSGASGGVINIVLKRDFSGGEVSLNYLDTSDFEQGQGQVDLTYGLPLEGGRTRLSVIGSWQKSLPLLYGARDDLRRRSIARILANDPDALEGDFVLPPTGTTSNFRYIGSEPLTLKPEFGGDVLAANYGHIPAGFRGVAVDGIAPLLTTIGSYNYDAPDSAVSSGRRAPLLYGSEQLNGSLTIRREFNAWLTGYTGLTLARSTSSNIVSRGPQYVELPGEAPNNPFLETIQVTLPSVGREAFVRNRQDMTTVIGGVIAKLPWGWQALVDLSYSRTRFQSDTQPSYVSPLTTEGLESGAQDVLRDFTAAPLRIVYDDLPYSTTNTPAYSSAFAPSLRVSGPLPLTLPGGRAQMTLNVEYGDEWIGQTRGAFNSSGGSTVTFTPAARQQTLATYGEVAVPLLAEANAIPLFRELELRLAARGEWYRGDGGDPLTCPFEGALPSGGLPDCPAAGTQIVRSVTRNSRIDPSISFRWVPLRAVILRGSYATGYLPPTLAQLVRRANDPFYVMLTDPLRGGEVVGVDDGGSRVISGFVGGNPDVQPEKSRTMSFGAILTPASVPGLRFSADWTRIRKRDVYFDPAPLAFAFNPMMQRGFETFIAANPGRVVRGEPSDGFAVGPITAIDMSLVNLVGMSTTAIDFVLDYHHDVLGGTLDFTSRATYVDSLDVETFPGAAAQNYAGVVTNDFASVAAASANGSLRWRGSAALNWTRNALTLGWQSRFFDRYALNVERATVPAQGGAYVSSQLYHDISIGYAFEFGANLRAGINNLFDTRPPLDASAAPLYYSGYGDPRLRNFYLGISKSF